MDRSSLGTRTVWILRGPPGSGKTTVGERLSKVFVPNIYISMDRYRLDEKGIYKFDPSKVGQEAARMKDEFRSALFKQTNNIILDNVHSRLWEYDWAVNMASGAGYTVHVIEVQSDLLTCWGRHLHTLPWDKFLEIFKRWETPVRFPTMTDMLRIVADLMVSK